MSAPLPAVIAPALLEAEQRWKPPPKNDNARRAPGAGETGLDNDLHFTPARATRKGAR